MTNGISAAVTAPSQQVKPTVFTALGLFISLFSLVALRLIFSAFDKPPSMALSLGKELAVWMSAVLLILIIRYGERLPLRSVGLGTASWRTSLRFGGILAGLCGQTAFAVVSFTGYGQGPGSAAFNRNPVWLATLLMVRAGVVEELFFRGYAIERMEALGCGPFLSAAIPLPIFALSHWTGGLPNVLIALAGGAVLTIFYMWRRDLVANMIGHGVSDFVGIVLPRLFH